MGDPDDNLTYLCGGEMDAGEFSLEITSEDLDPAEITRLLQLSPTSVHRRAEVIGKSGHTYKMGRWSFSTGRLDFRAEKSCEEAFDEFMRSLPGDQSMWAR